MLHSSILPLLACICAARAVSYTLEVRDWVVDYQRPTISPRKAPFDVPTEVKKAAILANDVYPGPVLEAVEGDAFEVTVVNQMIGQEVTGMEFDGVQVLGSSSHGAVMPQGGNITYRLSATKAGTFGWRARLAMQASRGLRGAIVVQSRKDPFAGMYKEEKLMAIAEEWRMPEVCLDGAGALLKGCPEIEKATLNGQWGDDSKDHPSPVFEVKRGQCYRLRFLGMMTQARFFRITIDEHPVQILLRSAEGTSFDLHRAVAKVPSFDVHRAEGVDVLLCADQGGLLGGDYNINMTYVGENQAHSFFAKLRYPLVSLGRQLTMV